MEQIVTVVIKLSKVYTTLENSEHFFKQGDKRYQSEDFHMIKGEVTRIGSQYVTNAPK